MVETTRAARKSRFVVRDALKLDSNHLGIDHNSAFRYQKAVVVLLREAL